MTYSLSLDKELFQGDFKSIEEALGEAQTELNLSHGQKFYVGNNTHLGYGEKYYPDAGDVIDMIGENAYEVSEFAENWLTNVTKEEKKDLQDMLNKTIKSWMKKHHQEATFWVVEDIKEYIISDDLVPQNT